MYYGYREFVSRWCESDHSSQSSAEVRNVLSWIYAPASSSLRGAERTLHLTARGSDPHVVLTDEVREETLTYVDRQEFRESHSTGAYRFMQLKRFACFRLCTTVIWDHCTIFHFPNNIID
jgi:hypothetical protein